MATGNHEHDTYIQQWLSQTVEGRADPGSVSVPPQAVVDHRHGTRHHLGHEDLKQSATGGRGSIARRKHSFSPIRGQLDVPERLGLQAVFRTRAEDEPITGRRRHGTDGRQRKRKRASSSDSSFLEADRGRSSHGITTVDNQEPRIVGTSNREVTRDGTSITASASTTCSEEIDMRYHRKPRHKTRGDLYDPTSVEKIRPKLQKRKDSKRVKKHKSKKKPASLLHEFSAKNVSGDRLTLKPSLNIGLFKNGRASSPVRGRGLPDLTFSEMKFLEKRKDKPEDTTTFKKARTKRERDPAGQEEISSYFTSANKVLTERNPNMSEIPARRTSTGRGTSHILRDDDSSGLSHKHSMLPLNNDSRVLPPEGFLGGGTRGVRYDTSPLKPETPSEIGFPENAIQYQSTRSRKSTTYFTWSRSGPPPETPNIISRRSSVEVSKPKRVEYFISPMSTIEVGQLANPELLRSHQDQVASKELEKNATSTKSSHLHTHVSDSTDPGNQDSRGEVVESMQAESLKPGVSCDVGRSTESHSMGPPASTRPANEQIPKDEPRQRQHNPDPGALPPHAQQQKRPIRSINDLLRECENAFTEPHIFSPNLRLHTESDKKQDMIQRPIIQTSLCSEATENADLRQSIDHMRWSPPLTKNTKFENVVKETQQYSSGMDHRNNCYGYGSRGLFGFGAGLARDSMPSEHGPQIQSHTSNLDNVQPSPHYERDSMQYVMDDEPPEVPNWDDAWPQSELHAHASGQSEPPFDTYHPRDIGTSDQWYVDDNWRLGTEERQPPMARAYGGYDTCQDLKSTGGYGYYSDPYAYALPRSPMHNEYADNKSGRHHTVDDDLFKLVNHLEDTGEDYHPVLDDGFLGEDFISGEHLFDKASGAFDFDGRQEIKQNCQLTESSHTSVPSFWRPHKLY